jgi:hypothetical protein
MKAWMGNAADSPGRHRQAASLDIRRTPPLLADSDQQIMPLPRSSLGRRCVIQASGA